MTFEEYAQKYLGDAGYSFQAMELVRMGWNARGSYGDHIADASKMVASERAARAQAEPSSGVPEGWKLVPEEPTEGMTNAAMEVLLHRGDIYENQHGEIVIETIAPRHLLKAMLTAAPAAPAVQGGRVAYVECRRCEVCDHIGINDEHRLHAACHMCEWHGPEPKQDQCPDCGESNCMAAACPECSGRYVLEDTISITTHPHNGEQGGEWVSVDERLPKNTGHYCIAVADPDDIGWSTSVSWTAFWNGDGFEDCDPVGDGQPVTHWMPLPQPPKSKEGEGNGH